MKNEELKMRNEGFRMFKIVSYLNSEASKLLNSEATQPFAFCLLPYALSLVTYPL